MDNGGVRSDILGHENDRDVVHEEHSLRWHHYVGFAVGLIVAPVAWLWFFGEPLKTTNIDMAQPVGSIIEPGSTVVIKYEGFKPKWSSIACRPVDATLHLRDGSGAATMAKASYGFNPGGTEAVPRSFMIPRYAAPGPAKVYEQVDYVCLGFMPKTYYTPPYEFVITEPPVKVPAGSTGGSVDPVENE